MISFILCLVYLIAKEGGKKWGNKGRCLHWLSFRKKAAEQGEVCGRVSWRTCVTLGK